MRRAVPVAAAACLLAGPTILAFYSGGFFIEPRLVAGIVAWVLVLALAYRDRSFGPHSVEDGEGRGG